MKIEKVVLKNFRAYQMPIEVKMEDLSVFVGKNDVGKSTILEALDVFFNDNKGVVKLTGDDLNKVAEKNGEQEIQIGVVLSNFPSEIIVDTTVSTTLEKEFLLNEQGFLEIHKTYKNGRTIRTELRANHPANDEVVSTLLSKKITELKAILKEKDLDCDKTKSSIIRETIRSSYSDLRLEETSLDINKEGVKQIWGQIESYLPLYSLFQADRSNHDGDSEVQDPLKTAVQEILNEEDIQSKLKEVAEKVEEISQAVVDSTLTKLAELNPDIAKTLAPNIPPLNKLKWLDVFKGISITSDDEIPLNKRGSGVRRLVLISFFASEAERRREKRNSRSIIYAIEEPETSQHPDHQKYLISSLIELAQRENTQVMLTTHHPATAQLLPVDSLNLVSSTDGDVKIESGEGIISKIAETLGVLPSLGKIAVCVEGENDRNFLSNICDAIPELKQIVDLSSPQIAVIPLKGSNLKDWVDRNYLEGSNVVEFHLYDRDNDAKYQNKVDQVNQRSDQSKGVLTKRLEMENYLPKEIYIQSDKFNGIDFSNVTNWEETDLVTYISDRSTKYDAKNVKQIINGHLSKKLTKSLLDTDSSWQEIEGWFKEIKRLLELCI